MHSWVNKYDLQPEPGKNPDHIAVNETVIQLNNEQYWLYTAVNPDTNELLHTTLELTTNTVISQQFLAEISERHEVNTAVFLIDGSHSLQAACHRTGYDFRYKKHGNPNAVERVFREIKRRTSSFSNSFSHVDPATQKIASIVRSLVRLA